MGKEGGEGAKEKGGAGAEVERYQSQDHQQGALQRESSDEKDHQGASGEENQTISGSAFRQGSSASILVGQGAAEPSEGDLEYGKAKEEGEGWQVGGAHTHCQGPIRI